MTTYANESLPILTLSLSNMKIELFMETPVGVLDYMYQMFDRVGITNEAKQYDEMLTASMIASLVSNWQEPELSLKNLLIK